MKAVGYIRVSTEEQGESGLSLADQDARVRARGVSHGWDVVSVQVDEVSGKNTDRPGLREVMALVKGNVVGAVIITKLDRLTRSVVDLNMLLDEFRKHDVKLVSMMEGIDTSTATGELLFNIMASIAQWERRENGERVAAALQARKSQGKTAGPPEYGKFADAAGFVHDNPQELAVLDRIRELRSQGVSYQVVADTLSNEGIRTRRGNAFTKAGVHYLARKSGLLA